MKCPTCWVRLVLTALALLGLTMSGRAQQPPQDQVALKFTIAGLTDNYAIPVSPPILSWKDTAAGQAPPLGQVTYVDHTTVHLGVDGKPLSCTDGVGAFTATSGDDLFITFSGLLHAGSTPDTILSEGAFTVTGGRGKLLGATGSGVITMEMNVAKNTATISLDGTVSRPKP